LKWAKAANKSLKLTANPLALLGGSLVLTFAPLRGANGRVDCVKRLVRSAALREPIVRPAGPPQ